MFSLYPLDAYKRNNFLSTSKDAEIFSSALENNLTRLIFLDFLSKLTQHPPQHIIIYVKTCDELVAGGTGSGKSFLAGFLSTLISRITRNPLIPEDAMKLNLTVESDQKKLIQMYEEGRIRILFTRTHLKKAIMYAKKENIFEGSTYLLDEKSRMSKIGMGSRKEEWYLADIEDQMRSLRMNFIHVSPNFDKYEIKNPTLVIGVLREINNEKGLSKALVYFGNDELPSGHIITKKPEEKFIAIYEFLKKYTQGQKLEGKQIGRTAEYEDIAKRVMSTPIWKTARYNTDKIYLIKKITEQEFTKDEGKTILGIIKRMEMGFMPSERISKKKIKELGMHRGTCELCRNRILPSLRKNKKLKLSQLTRDIFKHEKKDKNFYRDKKMLWYHLKLLRKEKSI